MRRKLGTITLTVYATDVDDKGVRLDVEHASDLAPGVADMQAAMSASEHTYAKHMMRDLCKSASEYLMFLRNPDRREVMPTLPGLPNQKRAV